MTWKQQLENFEASKEWRKAISLLEKVAEGNPSDPEPSVRTIYLLHNLLVEEDYKGYGFNHDHLADLLLKYFQDSYHKFENNAEYLFFVGIIMHIAEWYFGQEDTSLAMRMQEKAAELDPQNTLYEFSFRFSKSDKARARELSQKILTDNDRLVWLQSKGFPGIYVLRMVQYSPSII